MSTDPTPDLPALLDAGLDLFAEQVRHIDTGWDLPTPCAGWTVRDLVGHVLSTMAAGDLILRGQPVPPAPDQPGDAVDPQSGPEQVGQRVAELAEHFRASLAGADLEQTRETPAGPRTLADGLAFPIVDLAVHSWDLASALGRRIELPAELLAYADSFARSVPAEVTRRPGVFGPELVPGDDASATERLMAYLGREHVEQPEHSETGPQTEPGAEPQDAWARLDGPADAGSSDWVVDQLAQIDAAGTTDVVGIQGMKVVVLTMLGRRSGRPRRVPLMRVEHDGVYAAVASKGGAPEHPHWYHNLLAHPELLLQDGTTTSRRTARLATDAEREQWWPRCVEAFPPYAEYEEKTARVIPLFLLEPAD